MFKCSTYLAIIYLVAIGACKSQESSLSLSCEQELPPKEYYKNKMVLDDNLQITFYDLIEDSKKILLDIEEGELENVFEKVRKIRGMKGFVEDSLGLDYNWIHNLPEEYKRKKVVSISSNFPLYQSCYRKTTSFDIEYLYPKRNNNLQNSVTFKYYLSEYDEVNGIELEAITITRDDKKDKFLEVVKKINGY